jgi:hypothetical protein
VPAKYKPKPAPEERRKQAQEQNDFALEEARREAAEEAALEEAKREAEEQLKRSLGEKGMRVLEQANVTEVAYLGMAFQSRSFRRCSRDISGSVIRVLETFRYASAYPLTDSRFAYK